MGVRSVPDNRVCSKCGSSKTYIDKNGNSEWYRLKEGGFCCRKCRIRNPEVVKRANTKGNERRRFRNQQYKGKHITYLRDIRCGVCNWCRAVMAIDTKATQLHHDDNRYDDTDHLKFTLELCLKCHGKETIRLGRADSD
jgi:hypothetical protein